MTSLHHTKTCSPNEVAQAAPLSAAAVTLAMPAYRSRSSARRLALVGVAMPLIASAAAAQSAAPPPTSPQPPASTWSEGSEPMPSGQSPEGSQPLESPREVQPTYTEAAAADAPEGLVDNLSSAGPRGLDKNAQATLGLEAYGGVALLVASRGTLAHAVAGALARVKFRYFQLGAAAELSDRTDERWSSVGGFAGVWLPYRNWVDIDLTVGGAVRKYSNPDPSYGPAGYELSTPALTFRAGISDRSSDGLFGARLGAALVGAFDLKGQNAEWQSTWQEGDVQKTTSGATSVGGVTLGLLVNGGFDIGLSRVHRIRHTNVAGGALPFGS